MKNGFDFELYGQIFKNCFIHCTTYSNGNPKLSLFGFDSSVNQIAHFADITLEQDEIYVGEDAIIVDNNFKPTLVEQLEKLGIIKQKVKMCIINNTFYPIYTIDFSRVNSSSYYLKELIAA